MGGENVLDAIIEDVQQHVALLATRSPFLESLYGDRLSKRVAELSRLVDDVLVPVALVVDKAKGATYPELAELFDVERSTVRRKYSAAAEQMRAYAEQRRA